MKIIKIICVAIGVMVIIVGAGVLCERRKCM